MDANLNDVNERAGSRFVGWQLYRIAAGGSPPGVPGRSISSA